MEQKTQRTATYYRTFALPHVPHEPTSMKTTYLWVSRLGPHEVGHEGVAAGRGDFSLPSFSCGRVGANVLFCLNQSC